MSQPLVLSYVFTLLCLLLGAPFLLFKVARRARGASMPIVHGLMWGVGSETLFVLVLNGAFRGLRLGVLEAPVAMAVAGALWALCVEGTRRVALGRASPGFRTTRAAAHFGLGWGCGVAAYKGVLLLASLWGGIYVDPEQALAAFPEAEREALRELLGRQRTQLLEASPLRPPLEHVLQYGLDAFYHLVFTLVVVRTWTRGESAAWLKAAGMHAMLNGLAAALFAAWPGWPGLLLVLILYGAIVPPTYRWAARQIVTENGRGPGPSAGRAG